MKVATELFSLQRTDQAALEDALSRLPPKERHAALRWGDSATILGRRPLPVLTSWLTAAQRMDDVDTAAAEGSDLISRLWEAGRNDMDVARTIATYVNGRLGTWQLRGLDARSLVWLADILLAQHTSSANLPPSSVDARLGRLFDATGVDNIDAVLCLASNPLVRDALLRRLLSRPTESLRPVLAAQPDLFGPMLLAALASTSTTTSAVDAVIALHNASASSPVFWAQVRGSVPSCGLLLDNVWSDMHHNGLSTDHDLCIVDELVGQLGLHQGTRSSIAKVHLIQAEHRPAEFINAWIKSASSSTPMKRKLGSVSCSGEHIRQTATAAELAIAVAHLSEADLDKLVATESYAQATYVELWRSIRQHACSDLFFVRAVLPSFLHPAGRLQVDNEVMDNEVMDNEVMDNEVMDNEVMHSVTQMIVHKGAIPESVLAYARSAASTLSGASAFWGRLAETLLAGTPSSNAFSLERFEILRHVVATRRIDELPLFARWLATLSDRHLTVDAAFSSILLLLLHDTAPPPQTVDAFLCLVIDVIKPDWTRAASNTDLLLVLKRHGRVLGRLFNGSTFLVSTLGGDIQLATRVITALFEHHFILLEKNDVWIQPDGLLIVINAVSRILKQLDSSTPFTTVPLFWTSLHLVFERLLLSTNDATEERRETVAAQAVTMLAQAFEDAVSPATKMLLATETLPLSERSNLVKISLVYLHLTVPSKTPTQMSLLRFMGSLASTPAGCSSLLENHALDVCLDILDDTNRRPEKLRANASLLIQVTVETCLGGNTSIKQALLHEIGKTSFVARLLQCGLHVPLDGQGGEQSRQHTIARVENCIDTLELLLKSERQIGIELSRPHISFYPTMSTLLQQPGAFAKDLFDHSPRLPGKLFWLLCTPIQSQGGSRLGVETEVSIALFSLCKHVVDRIEKLHSSVSSAPPPNGPPPKNHVGQAVATAKWIIAAVDSLKNSPLVITRLRERGIAREIFQLQKIPWIQSIHDLCGELQKRHRLFL